MDTQPFQIDQRDGTIRLPGGVSISPDMSQDELRASPAFANATSRDCGTLPWIHLGMSGGEVEGKNLLVSLCYYDQMLVHVTITVDLGPPGPKGWSSYSLDTEAETKRFHERLLTEMFGPAPKAMGQWFRREPLGRDTLEHPVTWTFPWGAVTSCHDFKGGGTDIVVAYRNRHDEADKAYRANRPHPEAVPRG